MTRLLPASLPFLFSCNARKNLEENAPKNVESIGQVKDGDVPKLMQNARALVFTGVEDFGRTRAQTMAAGWPVTAFAQGGARETLTPKTGMFFTAQTAEAL